MQEIRSLKPPVVTGICDPNKSRTRHHRSFKKVIGLMKDELGRKIMTKFVGSRAKIYSCLADDGSENKKAERTKKCVIKRKIKFENYKNCL